eukprot:gene8843-8016_t
MPLSSRSDPASGTAGTSPRPLVTDLTGVIPALEPRAPTPTSPAVLACQRFRPFPAFPAQADPSPFRPVPRLFPPPHASPSGTPWGRPACPH